MNSLAVIIGFYNGHKYIKELLDSIFNQTYKNFHIFIFDDNSLIPFDINKLDLSLENKKKIIVKKRKKNLGYTMNFLNALNEIEKEFDFYSFCDQDDIWFKQKLENGINALTKENKSKPAIYGTKTLHVNHNCKKIIGKSINITKKLSFKNALLQPFAGGNTMILNYEARNLIISSLKEIKPASHDWWTYILITGNGGKVIYDKEYSMFYRQHKKNTVGSNYTFFGRFGRFKKIFNKTFKNYIDNNIEAININLDLFTEENKLTIEKFIKARNYNIFKKSIYFINSGLYRQNLSGNILFFIFFISGKI